MVEGDTPFGSFRVEWDAQGKLVSESIAIVDPAARFLTDADRAVIAVHLPICQQPCEHYRGNTVMTVACAKCGCAGLPLLSGQCPENKWPDQVA